MISKKTKDNSPEESVNGGPEKSSGKLPRTDPANWDDWISHRAVRKEFDLQFKAAHDLLDEAGIAGRRGADGTLRYPPDTIERLKPLIMSSDVEKPVQAVGSDLMSASASLVRMSEKHATELVECMVKPLQLALDVLEKTNGRLLDRNEKLESTVDASILARETLLSEVAARDIANREHESSEKRRGEAWGLLMGEAPTLIGQIKSTILNKVVAEKPEVRRQLDATIRLLTSIKPEQLQMLKMVDLLTEEQKADIDAILAETAKVSPQNGTVTVPETKKEGEKQNARTGKHVP